MGGIHHIQHSGWIPHTIPSKESETSFLVTTQNATPTYVTGTRTSNIHDKAQAHDPQKTRGIRAQIPLLGKRVRRPASRWAKKTSKLLEKLTLQTGPTIRLITGNQIPHNKLNFNQQGFRHLPVEFNKRKQDEEITISKIRSNYYHLKLPTVQRKSITNRILPNLLKKKKKNKISNSLQIPKLKRNKFHA